MEVIATSVFPSPTDNGTIAERQLTTCDHRQQSRSHGADELNIPFFQVDAFADQPLTGNSAAVMPLPRWIADEECHRIVFDREGESNTGTAVSGHTRAMLQQI